MSLQYYFDHYEKAHQHPGNRFCHKIGIPLIAISLILIFTSFTQIGWILFAIGWVLQIIGHIIERSRPEFLQSPIYLFIGPIYFVRKIMRK